MLNSLQYLRAFAALAVVLFHYRDKFVSAGGSPAIASLVDWGHGGVPIFFVLAGFIMVWTTRLTASPGVFLWRRAIRIYGGYLPIALAFLAFKAGTTGVEEWVPEGLNLVGSLTLTESIAARLLIFPTWSLSFELLFYLAFAICLTYGRDRFFPAALLVAIGIFALGSWGPIPADAARPMTSALNLLFILGLAVGWVAINVTRIDDRSVIALAVLCAVCLGYGFAIGDDQRPLHRLLGFGLGSSALILVLVELERRERVPDWPFLRRLGDASYALYLLHVPATFMFATLKFDSWLAWRGGPYAMLVVYLAVLLSASMCYFALVEMPITQVGRRLSRALSFR
ncbi:acyltransferase [Defluviimonas sp. WL0024]|uniref:Acyltransferase n=1 Tax=Albidovulum salinarum TaxID=2984153 RepID=A0ABT2X4E2_9RHOB|nr:acyltransferase [Defluviimonas sp. WL0024]MCU9848811.1 acyltransferase [Defluviimonas sp. WL0024]